MMRAHVEWERYGKGEWNYEKNEEYLKNFWREGIKRMGNNESIITLAMRGDGDMAMSAETNTALLERIVRDQREIIKEVTGKEITQVPQVWALYKEVQDYYDKGMRVPDDVTLLLCDDNWGNIRKLPKPDDKPRAGGYGIYYHFDYVGGPRNYKWLNTNQIERVWEQMHLAYEHGVDRIWVVNVGDIKPMELPIQFFLDYAWQPKRYTADKLPEYYHTWARQQFGDTFASDIAPMLAGYTQFNSRRKPELLSPDTYSLHQYRESERVVTEYNLLEQQAESLMKKLPPSHHDAYFQLVYHPIAACANLHRMYRTTALNRFYAKQGRLSANALVPEVQRLFDRDGELTRQYHALGNGRWNHMMDQTHISYTYWQQPPKDVAPETKTVSAEAKAEMGLSIEGSDAWWPNDTQSVVLPALDPHQQTETYFDIFNRGSVPFSYTVSTDKPWLKFSSLSGTVTDQIQIRVSVDWANAPKEPNEAVIRIEGAGQRIEAKASINPSNQGNGFIMSNGLLSMEAAHHTRAVTAQPFSWQVIPGLGRTYSGVTALPTTAPAQTPGTNTPRLEYDVTLDGAGEYFVDVYLSPTLNYYNDKGLHYALSFNEETPQVVAMHTDNSLRTWENWVANNVVVKTSTHTLAAAGSHTLKFWLVNPGVVVQKIVIRKETLPYSYLGPPAHLPLR